MSSTFSYFSIPLSFDPISYILNGKKVGTLIGGVIGAKIAMKVDEEKLR